MALYNIWLWFFPTTLTYRPPSPLLNPKYATVWVGRLGSGSVSWVGYGQDLVSWVESGVRVSATFHIFALIILFSVAIYVCGQVLGTPGRDAQLKNIVIYLVFWRNRTVHHLKGPLLDSTVHFPASYISGFLLTYNTQHGPHTQIINSYVSSYLR